MKEGEGGNRASSAEEDGRWTRGRRVARNAGSTTIRLGPCPRCLSPLCRPSMALQETERLVGDSARNQHSKNPRNTVYDAKRLIGRKFSDKEVQVFVGHGSCGRVADPCQKFGAEAVA